MVKFAPICVLGVRKVGTLSFGSYHSSTGSLCSKCVVTIYSLCLSINFDAGVAIHIPMMFDCYLGLVNYVLVYDFPSGYIYISILPTILNICTSFIYELASTKPQPNDFIV